MKMTLRELQKMAASIPESSEKEFFLSEEVQSSIENIVNALVESQMHINKRYSVKIIYDENIAAVAYTTQEGMTINFGCSFLKGLSTEMKFVLGLALAGHELSHKLWTNFSLMKERVNALNADSWNWGKRPPKKFSWSSNKWDQYLDEISRFLSTCKLNRKLFTSSFANFDNILEDGFIEEQFMKTFYGLVLGALYSLRDYQWEQSPTIEKMRENGLPDKDVFENICLTYAKYGLIAKENDAVLATDPMVKVLRMKLSALTDTVRETNSLVRNDKALSLFIDFWPIYKEEIGKVSENLADEILNQLKNEQFGTGDGNDLRGNAKGTSGASDAETEQSLNRKTTEIDLSQLPPDKAEEIEDLLNKKNSSSNNSSEKGAEGKQPQSGQAETNSDDKDVQSSSASSSNDSEGKANDNKSATKSSSDSSAGEDKGKTETDESGKENGENSKAKASASSSNKGNNSDTQSSTPTSNSVPNSKTQKPASTSNDTSNSGTQSNKESDTNAKAKSSSNNSHTSTSDIKEALEAAKEKIRKEKEDLKGKAKEMAEDKLSSLQDEIKTNKALNSLETEQQKANKSLAQSAASVSSSHKGVNYKITRYAVGNDSIAHYNDLVEKESLLRKAKIATKELRKELEKKKTSIKKGLRTGPKVNMRSYIQDKTSCFEKKKSPDDLDFTLCVLIDESGSMRGKKSEAAKRTAILIYEICNELKIPPLIIGHSDNYPTMDIFSYCDFEDITKMDKYRLSKVSGHNCTRDGAALIYAIAKLKERSEKQKLLIIISDGSPCSTDYHGDKAKQDIQAIVKTAEKAGIKVIAAAIDQDKEEIESIYGEKRFLDISDLTMLPRTLSKVVIKQLS